MRTHLLSDRPAIVIPAPPHTLSISDLTSALGSSQGGLSEDEAVARLSTFGPNELKTRKRAPVWMLFLSQLSDFMILVLIGAAVVAGMIGDVSDAIIILLIILVNASIGFVQEYRSEKAMEALSKLAVTQSEVIRDGARRSVSSIELVPGDIVVVEAGDVIPADMRLIEAHSLRIDESALTGESVPIDKVSRKLSAENTSLGDQLNVAFSGTLATNGRAMGVVFATGMETEFGKIARLLEERAGPTPLQIRMSAFGKRLSLLVIAICTLLFVIGILRGEEPFKILLVSISLAVAAIPEALPALITIALSRGASRLARQNALVRKLPAVESLGSVTYICTDKTGTLTQNRMRLVELYEHEGIDTESEMSLFGLAMALNHDVRFDELGEPFGEPTEMALVDKVVADITRDKFSEVIAKHARVGELPFDSDRKCMTTAHRFNGSMLIVTKGASESIDPMLRDANDARSLRKVTDAWTKRGIRVLAYAYRIVDSLPEPFEPSTVEREMTLLGVTGLFDPARDEVIPAIRECRTAGIVPVMVTGDHPATANTLAREIGILYETSATLTGEELRRLTDEAFLEQVERTAVYARVSPDQKLRIVRALQKRGHFAAMTGDGVNDAPSLRAANIGIAMGISGTDVSKEAADLILLDDNFATIVNAVKEGRRIYDNIRKFVKFNVAGNGAGILAILVPLIVGWPVPLLPVHLLWINLVTDGLPAIALASELPETDVMRRPPRPSTESLFSDGVGSHIVLVGILMAALTISTQSWTMTHDPETWQTMVFTVLSLSQLGHVLSIRSERTTLYQRGIFTNLPLIGAVLLTFALQLALIYVPFLNHLFRTQPLTLGELAFCMAMSAIVFHSVEIGKWARFRFSRREIGQ